MSFKGHWINGKGGGGGGTLATPRAIIPQLEDYRYTAEENAINGFYGGQIGGYSSTQQLWPAFGRLCSHAEGDVYYLDFAPVKLANYGSQTVRRTRARWQGIYTYDNSLQDFSTTLSNGYTYIGNSFIGENTDPQIIKIDIHGTSRVYVSPTPFDINVQGPHVYPLGGGSMGGGTGLIKQNTKYCTYAGSTGGGSGAISDQRIYPCENDFITPVVEPFGNWLTGHFFSPTIRTRGFVNDYYILQLDANWDWSFIDIDWMGITSYYRLRGIEGLSKETAYPITQPVVMPMTESYCQVGTQNPWGTPGVGVYYVQYVIQPQLFIRSTRSTGVSTPFAPNLYYANGTTYNNPGTELEQWEN